MMRISVLSASGDHLSASSFTSPIISFGAAYAGICQRRSLEFLHRLFTAEKAPHL
jgi:hypothetical protein